MGTEYVELTIFSLNNVSNYIKSVSALIEDVHQFGHAAGMALLGVEEFIRATNFYLLAVGDLNTKETKKIRLSNNKTNTGKLSQKFEDAVVIALQIVLSMWLQAKPESFEIFANYLTAQSDMERETFLNVMIEYLKGDNSNFAITFNTLLQLKEESKDLFGKVKSDQYLRVDKDNTLPITADAVDADDFLGVLKSLDVFGDSVSEFFRELFLSKELLAKFKKFDNNVRVIWPDIFKHF